MSDIPANQKLSITLEVQQWNIVIQVLGEAPYKIVQPIIQAMGQQAAAQTQPQPVQQPIPNGQATLTNAVDALQQGQV